MFLRMELWSPLKMSKFFFIIKINLKMVANFLNNEEIRLGELLVYMSISYSLSVFKMIFFVQGLDFVLFRL